MGDWKKSEAQLRKTINDMNVVTGANDTNIVDGVNRLIRGYEGGSNSSNEMISITTFKTTTVLNEDNQSKMFFSLDVQLKSDSVIMDCLYTYNCAELSSGTSLSNSVSCSVGDLIIASIITRDTLTLSDGWTLISTSGINSTDTSGNGQRLSFAYKYATNTTESITVTQASSQRLYITMVALRGATGFVDNGYSYVNSESASITVTKPSGLTLFGCSAPLWSTSSPYKLWTTSNDSVMIQLGTSTQSRLGVILDETDDTEVTITSGGTTSTLIVGSLTIKGIDSFNERIQY